MTGSELYHRTISFDYGDDHRRALMEEVWSVTPWVVNVFSDNISSARERGMMEWCRKRIGDEAHPIHGMPGKWQRGGATIFGWTWFGFTDKADPEGASRGGFEE